MNTVIHPLDRLISGYRLGTLVQVRLDPRIFMINRVYKDYNLETGSTFFSYDLRLSSQPDSYNEYSHVLHEELTPYIESKAVEVQPPVANFAKTEQTLGELRSDKSQDGKDWSPRDLLINLLRDIDNGQLKPTQMLVLYLTDTREKDELHFHNATDSKITSLGMCAKFIRS